VISDQAILRNIERQPKQAASFKQLVRELAACGDRKELSARLHALVRRGELVQSGDRYSLPKAPPKQNTAVGRLHMHRDGFGFVTPDDEALRRKISGDIFINPQAIGNAMHGDRVLVEIARLRDDGRAEGRILRVVGRAHPTVVGTFHYGSRYNYVSPMDEKVKLDIVIPRGLEIPEELAEPQPLADKSAGEKARPKIQGPQHASRDRVIGEEVKHHGIEWDDLDGVVVDVEITDWPTPTSNPRGRVVEVLGYEDDFGVDVEIVIRKHHIPHHFPVEVIEEAQQIAPVIPSRELRHRRDYRDLPIVTIDGETARDFDDAVFVRRLPNGNFELQVHIADVAHYMIEGSALDDEARLRGTSVYFPDRSVPMLPIELSTDICSLRPKLERLVMSCVMEIDHQGEVLGYEIAPGVIRSAERMTYTAVNAVLEGDPHIRQQYAQLADEFELMRELAMILNRKRVRRGSIDFDLPEPVIEFDENGLMRTITRSERNIAHRIIEEFMLSANESVASYLEQKGVPSLYRIHEKPDPRRVLEFETIAASFGYSLGVGPLPTKRFTYTDDRRPRRNQGSRTRGGQQRREIEIPEEVHITPRMYQKLTQKIAGTQEERILSYLMLRSLKQARYSEQNKGHFALAAPTYTHFTSPIRRYPDLIVHRILKVVLAESPELEEEVAPHSPHLGRSEPLQTTDCAGHKSDHKSAKEDPVATVPVGRGRAAGSETPSPWSKRGDWESKRDLATRESERVSFVLDDSRKMRKSAPKKGTPENPAHDETATDTALVETPQDWPIPRETLHEIALESSDAERRADDAERELMDWKKVKFMADRVGEDFSGMIISVTKFGLFVELEDLFIEGLVPLDSIEGDRYIYNDATKEIIGQRTGRIYSLGEKVRVIVDRIDPVERKIQFALIEDVSQDEGSSRKAKRSSMSPSSSKHRNRRKK
jgi:ribonuclease R